MVNRLSSAIIYRVERDNHGPYDTMYNSADWMTKEHNSQSGCPGPGADGFEPFLEVGWGNPSPNFHRFGFTSMEQLTAWFHPQERATLAARGFKIAIYQASDVYASDFQAIFRPREAALINFQELA